MLGQNLIIRGLVGNRLVGGTWTASGTWTIPAVTLSGKLSVLSNITIGSAVDNNEVSLSGDTTNSVFLSLRGKSHATTPGRFGLQTPNAALAATDRLIMSGGVDLAVATWSATQVVHATSIDSAAVADQVSLGGYEIGAGNRVLAISQETAVAVDVDETKFSHKLQCRINGATYFIMLTAT